MHVKEHFQKSADELKKQITQTNFELKGHLETRIEDLKKEFEGRNDEIKE